MRAALLAGGWLVAAAIVFLSLTPNPPELDLEQGDKLGHLLSYGVLSLWFCLLYRGWQVRLGFAALWVGMGIALEFAQGATGYRTFEFADMAANSLGVLLGWGISATLRR